MFIAKSGTFPPLFFPRTVAFEEGPDIVLFYLFARPGGFAEESKA